MIKRICLLITLVMLTACAASIDHVLNDDEKARLKVRYDDIGLQYAFIGDESYSKTILVAEKRNKIIDAMIDSISAYGNIIDSVNKKHLFASSGDIRSGAMSITRSSLVVEITSAKNAYSLLVKATSKKNFVDKNGSSIAVERFISDLEEVFGDKVIRVAE